MFHKISGFFSKLFGSAPTWLQKASTALSLVAPLTNTIIVMSTGEAEAASVTNIVHEVQADMATAATLIGQSHGDGGANTATQIKHSLDHVVGNLDGLLTAGHIKNPQTQTKVKVTVQTITEELKAIIAAIPGSTTA